MNDSMIHAIIQNFARREFEAALVHDDRLDDTWHIAISYGSDTVKTACDFELKIFTVYILRRA
jgi:hypothetical protein